MTLELLRRDFMKSLLAGIIGIPMVVNSTKEDISKSPFEQDIIFWRGMDPEQYYSMFSAKFSQLPAESGSYPIF